jgi:cyclophilin family peptidyl-prolyl cis-trans isomerase
MVIDLARGGRVVVQLAPAFAPVHVANIKALARGKYWDGATVYRVQDNYVAQWGQNESDKPWPAGVTPKPPAEYTRPLDGLTITPLGSPDPYAPGAGFADGWPVAFSKTEGWADLVHCYGSVGVGRDLSPDTGTGGELYAVIGHGPRQLDRVIALVGRVVDGIDRFSTLPRGTEALGFYKDKAQYVPIASVRLASDMPAAELARAEQHQGAGVHDRRIAAAVPVVIPAQAGTRPNKNRGLRFRWHDESVSLPTCEPFFFSPPPRWSSPRHPSPSFRRRATSSPPLRRARGRRSRPTI